MVELSSLKDLLETKYKQYHNQGFIDLDPISVPHRYSRLQDIEIVAFITATISWGNRTSIIKNADSLFRSMGASPYDFVVNHDQKDLTGIENWVHRTFQTADLLGFIHFLQRHYQNTNSLEEAFLGGKPFTSVADSLTALSDSMFGTTENMLERTRKHVGNPQRGSACKRLNMFLRWMVRPADGGVDFGIWKKIPVNGLMMPLDVHVDRVARSLGMLQRKQSDWKSVEELTAFCRLLDPEDPVKYDYALFGMGIEQKKISPVIL